MRTLMLLLATAFPLGSTSPAAPDCAAQPSTLAAMRDCARPLLIFSPAANDVRLEQQTAMLSADAATIEQRAVLLVLIVDRPGPATNGDKPGLAQPRTVTLTKQEKLALRKRFHVAPNQFRVVLLGKDGGSKLSSSKPVPPAQLNRLIDGMPMRQQEMQQQGSP